ncbi:MAG: DUF445 domain-containing protein [Weeksellaceae bacterium]|nr:DUF445 domain-containing protein [Weeksellaceae bacterium]
MASSKEIQLRNHKWIATGLFLLMAVIYSITVYFIHHSPKNWLGFVKAFSEAAMVGALADWFAVTALFRHPLGIKIPHTNLIQRKQKDLGKNLGKFVNDNFLNPATIRPYFENLNVVKIASAWLNKVDNQNILEEEIRGFLKKIILDLEDKEVEEFITKKGENLLKSLDYQKITSSGIHYLIEKEEHLKLLNVLLPSVKEYIQDSQTEIRHRLSENRPFLSFLAGKKISKELTDGFIAFVEEVQLDENHFIRQKLTDSLEGFAEDLLISENWDKKFKNLKDEFVSEENISPYAQELWQTFKTLIIENLEDSESLLKEYLQKNIQKLAENLEHDEEMSERINRWIRHFLYRTVLRNRIQVENLISQTVSNWEGKELSQKLELEVGKDLQYIRVNGTLVGGLVGLLIYTLTFWVF